MSVKKGGLGRGLDALFADVPVAEPQEKDDDKKELSVSISEEDRVRYIGIHEIMPNANQPRKVFSEETEKQERYSFRQERRKKRGCLQIKEKKRGGRENGKGNCYMHQ